MANIIGEDTVTVALTGNASALKVEDIAEFVEYLTTVLGQDPATLTCKVTLAAGTVKLAAEIPAGQYIAYVPEVD